MSRVETGKILTTEFTGLTKKELSFERVVNDIDSDNFIHDPYLFSLSLAKSEHPDMLTPYNINELSQMRLFQVKGIHIGFALKLNDGEYCDIVAVHNNEPSIKGVGKILLQAAIRNGGRKLDHFGSQKLTDLYESMEFREVKREEFDPKYDPDGSLEKRYGRLPIIFRELQI